jgi:anthranilate phosphoribosyltransferase
MALLPFLHKVAKPANLETAEAEAAMESILDGLATDAQIAGFLVALAMKGETSAELTGLARAMRRRCERVDVGVLDGPLVDTCGTGGSHDGTFNISTGAALVVAGAGVYVAKHGNRSISSACGGADVLECLGVNIGLTAAQTASAIREVGIGFLFAPALHPAMRNAHRARTELKMRTAFNLLGPLTNPAGARLQLAGAPSRHAAELMAGALAALGAERALIVHGEDGLDEISTTGPTFVYEIRGGAIAEHTLTPDDFGVPTVALEQLRGGNREDNANTLRAVLSGERGPRRDIIAVNAGAVLHLAGRARSLIEGRRLAENSIDSGAAKAKLDALIEFSNRFDNTGRQSTAAPG